jgi:hypothetical protein
MAPKTIVLRSANRITDEYPANAAITPGHLVELISTGKVQKQATGALRAPMMFAIEDGLKGSEIGTAYVADNRVQVWHAQAGDKAYGWLQAGSSAVVIGDELEVGTTDGMFVKRASGISVATALEALDISASAAVSTRIKMQIH